MSIGTSSRELRNLEGTLNTIIDNRRKQKAIKDAQFARLVAWAKEVSDKTGIPMPQL